MGKGSVRERRTCEGNGQITGHQSMEKEELCLLTEPPEQLLEKLVCFLLLCRHLNLLRSPTVPSVWRLKYQQLGMTMKSQSGRALKREPLEASSKGKSISVVIFCLPWRASKARREDGGWNLPLKVLTIIISLMAMCNSHSRKGQRHLWVLGSAFHGDY